MRFSLSSSLLPRVALRFAVCFLALAASGAISYAKGSFTIRPPQSWVLPINPDLSANGIRGTTSTLILEDYQVRVGEGTADRYFHYVQRVESGAGLDDLSQLRFYFEPTYQRLTIHFIRILRNGQTINALRPGEIKIIQQETELDQQLYNGNLATLVFLHDLRVGDVVEYAFTVQGENPVLGGLFAETLYLSDTNPVCQLSVRLVTPTKRTLSIVPLNIEIQPQTRVLGSDTEYIWERRDVNSPNYEDSIPAWFNQDPLISVSEFRDWQAVVQWALPLYRLKSSYSPMLAAKIEGLKGAFDSAPKRAIAALRFVQDEIRYLGIEMGRYSHQPASPETVFARRFGDCKDKSMLLSAMLNSMGIQAAPALVSTNSGRSLDRQPPSPFAFDHVIVQAVIEGKTYWFDATQSYQRGQLSNYYHPDYERALVLRDGISQLEVIPESDPGASAISTSEYYQSNGASSPVSLIVSTTYTGAAADDIRYFLANQTPESLNQQYLNYYANDNPSIRADAMPHINDDELNNRIVVEEKYLIDSFWKEGKHYFLAERIYSETTKPAVSQRSMPLKISHPTSIKQTTIINLSDFFDVRSERKTIANDAVQFQYDCSKSGNVIRLEYSFRTFADSVPVEKVQAHMQTLDKIQNLIGFELRTGVVAAGPPYRPLGSLGRAVLIVGLAFGGLIVIAVVAGTVLVFRRNKSRSSAWAGAVRQRVGSSPETAMQISSEDELETLLLRFPCSCGNSPYSSESPPQKDRFTYDGQRFICVRFHCSQCGQNSDLYVRPESSEDQGFGSTPIESVGPVGQ